MRDGSGHETRIEVRWGGVDCGGVVECAVGIVTVYVVDNLCWYMSVVLVWPCTALSVVLHPLLYWHRQQLCWSQLWGMATSTSSPTSWLWNHYESAQAMLRTGKQKALYGRTKPPKETEKWKLGSVRGGPNDPTLAEKVYPELQVEA